MVRLYNVPVRSKVERRGTQNICLYVMFLLSRGNLALYLPPTIFTSLSYILRICISVVIIFAYHRGDVSGCKKNYRKNLTDPLFVGGNRVTLSIDNIIYKTHIFIKCNNETESQRAFRVF